MSDQRCWVWNNRTVAVPLIALNLNLAQKALEARIESLSLFSQSLGSTNGVV